MTAPSFAGCSAGALLAAGTSAGAVAVLPAVLPLCMLLLLLRLLSTSRCMLGCAAFSASESAALVSRKVFCASSARCTSSQLVSILGFCKQEPGTSACCT